MNFFLVNQKRFKSVPKISLFPTFVAHFDVTRFIAGQYEQIYLTHRLAATSWASGSALFQDLLIHTQTLEPGSSSLQVDTVNAFIL